MKTVLMLLEFFSGILLVFTILLHSPKGEGLGAIGGPAKMYNAHKGLESGLDKLTGVMAIIFMVTAIVLGMIV
jgi:preprotein translocase subunit SecG